MKQTALIIGAGPAGLTAAKELLEKTAVKPVILEMSKDIGGISKTVNYKGNRIDIGGHRFFSKSDRVMNWWLNVLPVEQSSAKETLTYHNKTTKLDATTQGPNPATEDKVMLIRNRVSRIYYLRKFFDYPISLSVDTLKKLGLWRTFKIMVSYLWARVHPIKTEASLEDFFINRFGRQLYQTFFKEYTEKVWGLPPRKISPEWGAQRIKGISITKVLKQALTSLKRAPADIRQKGTETSLIQKFLYPKLGPGQLWEEVAAHITIKGGEIQQDKEAVSIIHHGNKVLAVKAQDQNTGERITYEADYFFSTMPVKDLVNGMTPPAPKEIQDIANGLMYRDFITVGLLLKKLKVQAEKKAGQHNKLIPDNWIYIQEPGVKVGRIQIFNNWSPYMVADQNTVWVGLEFFCNETDDFWQLTDEEIKKIAIKEVADIDIAYEADVLDGTVIRMKKTYPAYFGTYADFGKVRKYLDGFENLFLIGRNGMHKYNNQDHSMLTAMEAVDNIAKGIKTKDNIWAVNTEEDYHEEKK